MKKKRKEVSQHTSKYLLQVFTDETTCIHTAKANTRAGADAWVKHAITHGIWTLPLIHTNPNTIRIYPPHRIHHIDILEERKDE